jgi:hypothetical protein
MISLTEVARDSMLKAQENIPSGEGVWQEAQKIMLKEIKKNKQLYKKLVDPLVSTAVWEYIKREGRNQRVPFYNTDDNRPPGEKEKLEKNDKGIRAINTALWMNYPLAGGLRVGDATITDLEENIAYYKTNTVGNLRKWLWLDKIKSKMVGTKTVRQCLTEKKLSNMNEKATQEVVMRLPEMKTFNNVAEG